MPSRLFPRASWKTFGPLHGHNTASSFTTTFHTRISLNLPSSFLEPSSTMKTKGLYTSLRIYCPCLYFECLQNTFSDEKVFKRLNTSPESLIQSTLTTLQRRFKKSYPWSLGKGRALPNAYVLPKRKKQFLSGRPIVSLFTAPFRPMLNCIAKLIYQLLPVAFPHNLAKGDVFELIQLLKQGDFDSHPTPQVHNQDLAGFFTSIDTDRFVTSWHLTLHFLSSTMNTQPDELFSVKPSVGNQQGDVVKGRTCRTLNVTRKIYIRDIEPIIRASLEMTQFSIGTAVFQQIRGSPMGSPLSPALCLMVVALSEEVWYRTYESQLSTMDLTSRCLRYVDNRLCLPDSSWVTEPAFELFLHPDFYGKPIVLETEPDQAVPRLHLGVRPLHASIFTTSRSESSDGPVFRISFKCPAFRVRVPPVLGGKMCPPFIRTVSRFCRTAPSVQTSWFL